jgi:hypothetical protein
MRLRILASGLTIATTLVAGITAATPAFAAGLSGAIFTSNFDGSEVNGNQYPSKDAVYLDGGPGVGAPTGAAGLPAGTYSFQVTDPSGKTLLSTDDVACRQFTVDNSGVITAAISTGPCPAHHTEQDVVNQPFGLTVQLIPFNDTPNNGGEYKVWVTPTADLNDPDCAHLVFGFCPDDSKTDNFKVKQHPTREIDTTFRNGATDAPIDGLSESETDTLGASNVKWSYTNLNIGLRDQAHIEATESGTHTVTLYNQPGCTIGAVYVTAPGQTAVSTGVLGPQTVSITIPKTNNPQALSWFIDVYCV